MCPYRETSGILRILFLVATEYFYNTLICILAPKHNGARLIKSNLQLYITYMILYESDWMFHEALSINENFSLEALMSFWHHVTFTCHCVLSTKTYSKPWMNGKMCIVPKHDLYVAYQPIHFLFRNKYMKCSHCQSKFIVGFLCIQENK